MRKCADCLYALAHRDGRLHCHHPIVNRDRPSFLAGNVQSAVQCFGERQSATGKCGRRGLLWLPRSGQP